VGWSFPTNAIYYFEIPKKKWAWISGNSTGSSTSDVQGYFPLTIGVSSSVNLSPPSMLLQSFSYDNRFIIFGGSDQNANVRDATFVFEVCNSNSYFANGSCLPCQSWQTRTSGLKALDSCVALCPTGKFLQDDVCVDCPPGRFLTAGICESCQAGLYTSSSGYTACSQCNSGFYTNSSGASYCMFCSAGRFASSLESSSCLECSDGFEAKENSSNCQPCPMSTYSTPDHSQCISCPTNSITLSTANQFLQNCVCNVGYYGFSFNGKICSKCSTDVGVSCSKYNLTKPEILAGYYRNPSNENSALKCAPSSACPETSQFESITSCAQGYTGYLCGDCVAGEYYKQGIVCTSCPSKASQILSWVAIILVAIIALVVAAKRVEKFSTELRILIFWIQILSLYPSVSPSWPPALRNFLQVLSGLNFDIQITSPGTLSHFHGSTSSF
jgi:hypothetical protein